MKIFGLIAFATLICGLSVQSAYACSCVPLGEGFFETVFLHNQKVQTGEWSKDMALTIVTAQVKEYKQLRPGPHPTEMVLDISGLIQGELNQTELLVEGDDGFQCRPYVNQFPIGKSFVFALNQYNGAHYISFCGKYGKEISQP